MPKDGFNVVTLPNELIKDIDGFVNNSNKLVSSRAEALKFAWMNYKEKQSSNFFLPKKDKIPKVKINDVFVGDGEPTFIVAEIGINHNGDIEIAKKLIDLAADAGCDAVKFQKRDPDKAVPENYKNVKRETPWGVVTYLEYKKKIEFGKKEYWEIDNYCKEKGIMWFASCWDEESVDFLEKFDPPCYKLASASLTDKNLLKYTKPKGKPIILSTGMSTIDEIKSAVDILGKNNLILMHTNSSYPSKYEELNLSAIQTLKRGFNCPVGYSGHEVGLAPSLMAVVLGACIVERHITLDRSMWGTDQAASVEPQGLKKLIRDIRLFEIVKGDGVKRVYDSELPIKKKLRRASS